MILACQEKYRVARYSISSPCNYKALALRIHVWVRGSELRFEPVMGNQMSCRTKCCPVTPLARDLWDLRTCGMMSPQMKIRCRPTVGYDTSEQDEPEILSIGTVGGVDSRGRRKCGSGAERAPLAGEGSRFEAK